MKNYVITIGRQYGSGGREIGRMLAEKLGIEFYDSELLREKAKEMGIENGIFDMFDEKPTKSFLFSLSTDATYAAETAFNSGKVIEAQRKVINNAANHGPCIIVGRRADKIIENDENLVSIFISADIEDRIANYIKRNNADSRGARRFVERKDKDRASYYNYFGDGKWGQTDNYTMSFSTSKMDKNDIVDIIVSYINKKFSD